jgi:PAS domain-containing protein
MGSPRAADAGGVPGNAMPPIADRNDYFRTLFNAFPSPVIVVDDDVRIQDANTAGYLLLGNRDRAYHRRGGDILSCIHADETASGCGHSGACGDCVVRNSVREAARGERVVRTRTRMELKAGESISEVFLLVTASPFSVEGSDRVLLVLEDVSELTRLKSLLPMCAWCRKFDP